MENQVKSLGYRTDFIFNRFDGSVEKKDNYIVAITKSNPDYFWGNLLLYPTPPKKGDITQWKADFEKEFRNIDVHHITLAWDSPSGIKGEIEEFLDEGFELANSIVLTADKVIKPRKFNDDVQLKVIENEGDFEKCINVQISGASEKLSKESWEGFYRASMDQYKKMIYAKNGLWFGAVLNEEIVGSLGIFVDGKIGRFQLVSTHPDFQRQGICSTLVYESANYGFDKMNLENLVMVADENYHAAKIYESVGFFPTERQIGLCWWDKNKHK